MDTPDHLRLPDGRRLDVRVSGPQDGTVLIFHHGTPGAATGFRAIARAAHERGLRLVSTSRPGVRGLEPAPGSPGGRRGGRHRRGGDGPRCRAFPGGGVVGGGPHTLACGARLPRVAGVLVIAGVAPFGADGLDWMAGMGEENMTEFGAALAGESRLRAYLDGVREHLTNVTGEGIVSSLGSLLPEVDRAVLTDEFGQDMAAGFHEGLRVGVDGWLDDDLAFTEPWGFELDEIPVPVMLWQGSADLMVPFGHGRWLASHLPGASVHLEEGEGHLSIALGAADRMLDELVGVLPPVDAEAETAGTAQPGRAFASARRARACLFASYMASSAWRTSIIGSVWGSHWARAMPTLASRGTKTS